MRERPSLIKTHNIGHATQLHCFWKLKVQVCRGHPDISQAANEHEDSGGADRRCVDQDVQQPVHYLAAGLLEGGSFDEVGDVDEQLQEESKGIQAEHVLQHHSTLSLKSPLDHVNIEQFVQCSKETSSNLITELHDMADMNLREPYGLFCAQHLCCPDRRCRNNGGFPPCCQNKLCVQLMLAAKIRGAEWIRVVTKGRNMTSKLSKAARLAGQTGQQRMGRSMHT